ncbi:ankyrin repeat domain-containing protein [Candidatus Mesenet endosymbiont of Agriotes lineatus]|uniref:ankyrin repeat domain-containing protein n=1 Tax=Candidatus Mesenet endosymbiont of Agriotes lineatus TaxID=3077948 RepID=UPI0030D390F7
MRRELVLGSIITGSIGVFAMSSLFVAFPFRNDPKGLRLGIALLAASSFILCVASIILLKLSNKLLDASKKGDTAKVKSLLKIGINVDTKDWNGSTPLLLAIEKKHIETVKLLLKHNANVNVKNGFWTTPLSLSIREGYIEIAELLLEHGADVAFAARSSFAEWKDDNELAIFAAAKGYTKILELLLNRGVSANLKRNSDTLLHLALEKGHTGVVALLLKHGADINAKCVLGRSPLDHAICKKYKEIVRLLLERGANANLTDSVFSAAYNGCSKIMELLLRHGADVGAIGNFGDTPLHIAAEFGHTEIVKFLLDRGVNINAANNYHNTPLYKAIRNNHVETFFTLLIFGANIDEEWNQAVVNSRPDLNHCLMEFKKIKNTTHLGKIIQGYKERNLEVILDYISKYGRENNIEQLIQELQSIKGCYSSNESQSFIPETLLDIVKYMVQQYMSQHRKTRFKIGALSDLIYQAIDSQLKVEISLEDIVYIVSSRVASTISDQDAVNLSLVCKSINDEANDRAKTTQCAENMLLTQLEKIVVSSKANIGVGGPQVGG